MRIRQDLELHVAGVREEASGLSPETLEALEPLPRTEQAEGQGQTRVAEAEEAG